MSDLRTILTLEPRKTLADAVVAQIVDLSVQKTKTDKEYLSISLHDGGSEVKIKVWADDPSFAALKEGGLRNVWKVSGDWSVSDYGVELKKSTWAAATDVEKDALFSGGTGRSGEMTEAWEEIQRQVAGISHLGVRAICEKVLTGYGEKFRRAAAARKNHHAMRGGLLLHTAQMMRTGKALIPLYHLANPDILTASILFHDLGKIFENDYAEGFVQQSTFSAELLGHISIGMQTFVTYWNEIYSQSKDKFLPEQDIIKAYICHCILAHHGQLDWGSPVEPRCPEAFILHTIDQLDAKMEMLNNAYQINKPVVENIVEAAYPLRGSVALPFNVAIKAKQGKA
jgi:3'-5' exoribonuclease